MNPRYDGLKGRAMPAWMSHAFTQIGQREVSGPASNPVILRYREEAQVRLGGDDGQVPWCAIWTNAMLERAGVRGTRSGMARSYASSEHFERLARPLFGCIVVLSSNRGPASGHVGFYAAEDGLMLHLLGGNQNDEVNISAFQKKRLVGFFWPRGQLMDPAFAGPVKLARPLLPHERKPVRDA
jgi:uncharacterized protein (TIGR02594 family)